MNDGSRAPGSGEGEGANGGGEASGSASGSSSSSTNGGPSGSGLQQPSSMVSTYKHYPWDYVSPSLCRGSTRTMQERESYIRRQLSSFVFRVEFDRVVREIMEESGSFMVARDELPIFGYFDSRIRTRNWSLCPFCLRAIMPGHGLHFKVVELTRDPIMRWLRPALKVEWIRNQREVDTREWRPGNRFSRNEVERLVENFSSVEEFKELWYDKARSCIRKELKELYFDVRQEFSFLEAHFEEKR
jgi:hypothetical protein